MEFWAGFCHLGVARRLRAAGGGLVLGCAARREDGTMSRDSYRSTPAFAAADAHSVRQQIGNEPLRVLVEQLGPGGRFVVLERACAEKCLALVERVLAAQ